MDIINLLHGNTEGLSEEEKAAVEEFSENLKEALIEELVIAKEQHFIKTLQDDKEKFKEDIRSVLVFGNKGYNNMSLELLINIFLEEIGDEKFVKLINEIK
ncbi:MAG: hypothetical protein E7214_00270 [Clostridium sp.]|nr:hypothetical protein [Clostridium sp.]